MNFFNQRFDRRHDRPTPPSGLPTPDLPSHSSAPLMISWSNDRAKLAPTADCFRHLDMTRDLGREMLLLLDDPKLRVLCIDLSGIVWISSEALTQFARAHYRASQSGKEVVLENVGSVVRNVLHLTRLDRIFEQLNEQGGVVSSGGDSLRSNF